MKKTAYERRRQSSPQCRRRYPTTAGGSSTASGSTAGGSIRFSNKNKQHHQQHRQQQQQLPFSLFAILRPASHSSCHVMLLLLLLRCGGIAMIHESCPVVAVYDSSIVHEHEYEEIFGTTHSPRHHAGERAPLSQWAAGWPAGTPQRRSSASCSSYISRVCVLAAAVVLCRYRKPEACQTRKMLLDQIYIQGLRMGAVLWVGQGSTSTCSMQYSIE